MRKALEALCALAVFALAITACNRTSDTHDADIKALKANEARWNQDFAAKDADMLASHYASDAVLIVAGEPPVEGKEAIHDAYQHMLSDPAMSLQFQATKIDVAKSGDLAYTRGTYHLTITDPNTKKPVSDHGNYVTTLRKQADGTWKAVVDIVVSEVPPAPSHAKSAVHTKAHHAKAAAHARKKR